MNPRMVIVDADFDGPPEQPTGRVHTCSTCRTVSVWTDGWSWFGSYKEIDDGKPVLKFCSNACADQMPEVAAARAQAAAEARGDKNAAEMAEIDSEELALRKQLLELRTRRHQLQKNQE